MPFSVNWYIENEIIFVHLSGVLTADEVRESLLTVAHLIDTSPRSLVHIITDTVDIVQPLSSVDNLKVMREVGNHERNGWSVILGEKSMLVKIGVAIATSLFRTRTRTFDTLEDAEAFLKEVDTTLSWERADRSVLEPGGG